MAKIRREASSMDLFMPMGKNLRLRSIIPHLSAIPILVYLFWFWHKKHCACLLGLLSAYVTARGTQRHITNQMSIISYVFLLQGSEVSFRHPTSKIQSRSLREFKRNSCLGISGFKLSLESCSPLPISLTVLHIACCVENKCMHFSVFITSLFLYIILPTST